MILSFSTSLSYTILIAREEVAGYFLSGEKMRNVPRHKLCNKFLVEGQTFLLCKKLSGIMDSDLDSSVTINKKECFPWLFLEIRV